MASYAPLSDLVTSFSSPWNNQFVTAENSKRSIVDVVGNTSIRDDLNNDRFGSTTTIELPQNVILKNSILVLKIDKDDLPATVSLERGWGYNAIKRITFQVAGSGQTLEMTGQALLVKNLADAESNGKGDRLMELAGEAFSGNTPATKDYVAYVNLYLPWGSVSSDRYLGYDASILRSPASIRVELNSADKVITKSITNTGYVFPSNYKESFVATRTQIIRGESSPLRELYGVGTNSRYVYPFMYPQHEVKAIQGAEGSQLVSLNGFRSGNLQSIDMWLVRETFSGDIPMSQSAHSQLRAYAPRNVRLLYGGQEIYRADDSTDQMFNLCDSPINISWSTAVNPWNNTSNTIATAQAKQSSYLHVQLSQYNESHFCDLMQKGYEMVSQNVQLQFETPQPDELFPLPNPLAQVKWTLHMNYNYLAGVATRNGDTQLEFKSPQMVAL